MRAESKRQYTKEEIDQFVKDLDLSGWSALADPVEAGSLAVGAAAVRNVVSQLKVGDRDKITRATEEVVRQARQRGAELVGMRRLEDGTLIPNPNAKWTITKPTRKNLRAKIVNALDQGMTGEKLAKEIASSESFTIGRARAIARTEMRFANVRGNHEMWEKSGVVVGHEWLLSNHHWSKVPEGDICDVNAAQGVVKIGQKFKSGHFGPPAHPYCECGEAAVVRDQEG